MKIRKKVLLILSVVMVLTIFSTSTMADGVNQTNEIQGITTTTYIDVVGMASNNVELAWTSSSDSVPGGTSSIALPSVPSLYRAYCWSYSGA